MANKYKIRRKKRTVAEKASARASLKTRTITAIFLIFIASVVIVSSAVPLHLGYTEIWDITKYFFVGFGTIAGFIATYEITNVKALKNKWDWEPFWMMFILVPLMMFLTITPAGWTWDWTGAPTLSLPIIIIALGVSFTLPVFKEKYNAADSSYIFGNAIFMAVLFKGMIYIYVDIHPLAFITLMIISVTTDTFAYIGGYFFGNLKLIPRISPKKTWEGAIIGTIFGSVAGIILFYLFKSQIFHRIDLHQDIKTSLLFVIPFTAAIASQVGDLIFSAIKRRWNIKDFSNIFPGHGGILDRSDSLAGSMMMFLAFYTFLIVG